MHAHNMHQRLTTALSLLCAWSTTRYPSATPLLFRCQSLVRCAHATVINYQFSKIYCVAEEELSHSFNIAYYIKSRFFVNQNFLNNFVNSTLSRSLKDLFNISLTWYIITKSGILLTKKIHGLHFSVEAVLCSTYLWASTSPTNLIAIFCGKCFWNTWASIKGCLLVLQSDYVLVLFHLNLIYYILLEKYDI